MYAEEDTDLKAALQKAICDNSIAPFNSYLLSESCESRLVNISVLQELQFLLQAECNVSENTMRTKCVLSFLEYAKTVSCESEEWDAVARDLVTLCALCLLNGVLVYKTEENREELLINITHAISDLMNVSPKVSEGIVHVLAGTLLSAVVKDELSFTVRRDFLTTVASMITMSTVQTRHFVLCKHKSELCKLSDFMVTCGDYELQSTVLEIILQLLFAAGHENEISQSLFPSYPTISVAFTLHSFENFRSELRQFLNTVNSLSEKRLVYTLPCVAAFLYNKELRKPDEYTEFWVDFCISSECLYINHQGDTATPCNLTCISKKSIEQIVASECSYNVKTGTVQCIRVDIYIDTNELLKIYFLKTDELSLLLKNVLIPLFGKKYQDGSMVTIGHTPYMKSSTVVQNDSPDEILSSPQKTLSNKKNKIKLMKSIYKNRNKNNIYNNRSRILETGNMDMPFVPDMGLIRKRKNNFYKDSSHTDKKDDNKNSKNDNNNNNTNSSEEMNNINCNEERKKDNRSKNFINMMPTVKLIDIANRKSNKVVVNGKLSPVIPCASSNKETEQSKAESKGTTPRNSLDKRKLYSFQNEEYGFSSLEEYNASLPDCYKMNRGKQNELNSKVTYSYRANRSVENKLQQQDMIFSDVLESKYKNETLMGTPKHFPLKIDVPKNNKLKKQQKPLEHSDDSIDENKFFTSNKFSRAGEFWKRTPIKKPKQSENTKSVYSDLSSSETGTIHMKVPVNTYSRKSKFQDKRTKSRNRKSVYIDSDTDTDYKPSTSLIKVTPTQRCTRKRHRQSSVITLVSREHEDPLRDCSEAESSEELPLCIDLNHSNGTVTKKDVQPASLPLLPEVVTNAGDDFENEETILLKFSPPQESKKKCIRKKNSVQKKSKTSEDGPVRKRKYIQVKNQKISRIKNEEISEESTTLAKPHTVIKTNSQKGVKVNNDGVENKNSGGNNQSKNTTSMKKSGATDQNTFYDDLTINNDEKRLPESNICGLDDADVQGTPVNIEMDNSQSSVRSSFRIKDMNYKDDLCRFGNSLTTHMKKKLEVIQDACKAERSKQYLQLDSVLIKEMDHVEKQKQQLLSVAKEMETCRKILEGTFSMQMKSCEEMQRSISNINIVKKRFFKDVEKTEAKQSSRFTETMKVFKDKIRAFVTTFIAADKKLLDSNFSQA